MGDLFKCGSHTAHINLSRLLTYFGPYAQHTCTKSSAATAAVAGMLKWVPRDFSAGSLIQILSRRPSWLSTTCHSAILGVRLSSTTSTSASTWSRVSLWWDQTVRLPLGFKRLCRALIHSTARLQSSVVLVLAAHKI